MMTTVSRLCAAALVAVIFLLPMSGAAAGEAVTEDDMVLGRRDAPVTVIEYFSFSCSHCARFHRDVFPPLKRDYIDTGKVRFVLRDFPLNLAALSAATLARCGGRDRYFELVDLIWARWDDWIGEAEPDPALASLLGEAGIGEARVDACLNDQELQDDILRSYLKGAREHGVERTPSFIIGGKKYVGMGSYEQLSTILDALVP